MKMGKIFLVIMSVFEMHVLYFICRKYYFSGSTSPLYVFSFSTETLQRGYLSFRIPFFFFQKENIILFVSNIVFKDCDEYIYWNVCIALKLPGIFYLCILIFSVP